MQSSSCEITISVTVKYFSKCVEVYSILKTGRNDDVERTGEKMDFHWNTTTQSKTSETLV